MRLFENLTATPRPAWPELQHLVDEASVGVEILEPDDAASRRTLEQLQVTTGSFLGAVVVHTGGLLIDQGWLRVYGSPGGTGTGTADDAGSAVGLPDPARLPGLAAMNEFPPTPEASWYAAHGLVVAHDVLGGTYALNGPHPGSVGRPGGPGEMTYLAPDTLQWEPLGAGYAAWLTWVLDGGLTEFTEGLRWDGWEAETRGLAGDSGLNFFPPLWSKEAHEDLGATSRAVVPMSELVGMARATAAQIDEVDLGPLGTFDGPVG